MCLRLTLFLGPGWWRGTFPPPPAPQVNDTDQTRVPESLGWWDRLPLARWGLREVGRYGGALLLAVFLLVLLGGIWRWVALLPGALLVLLVWFFRDPPRAIPAGPGLLVAPADGKVVDVSDLDDEPFLGGPATRIGIFLSIFDVHINRAPTRCRVVQTRYKPGEFLNAMNPASAERNESMWIGLEEVANDEPAEGSLRTPTPNPSPEDGGGGRVPSDPDAGGEVVPSDPDAGGEVAPSDPDAGGEVAPSDPDAPSVRVAKAGESRRMIVRQISGLIARRIVCDLQVGQTVDRGEQIGMIKLGSRTELIVPRDNGLAVTVSVGDRVKAGATVVGRYS